MKTFIEFETIFNNDPIIIKNVEYSASNFNKLDGTIFDVHEHFGNENIITMGRLYWDEDKKILFARMWLESTELDYFDKEIFTGRIIPVNIRIAPDSVNGDSVKYNQERDFSGVYS
jgi:hypothetical protein